MKVVDLLEQLTELVADGRGDTVVFASKDEEGNGFHTVDDVELRKYDPDDEDTWWEDEFPEDDVVIIW